MKIQVSKINEDGFYLEPVIIDDDDELTQDLIPASIPEGFYHPKWDGEKWIEGLSEEEISILKSKHPTSEMDILRQENEMHALAIMELAEILLRGR